MEIGHCYEVWDKRKGMVLKGNEEWLWGEVVEGYKKLVGSLWK